MADPIRIGLLGFGNIGAGVARNLHAHRDTILQRVERPLELIRIADIDTATPRDVGGFDYSRVLTNDAAAVVEGSDIDIVIELIGGYEPARSLVERALKAGKHVVTANKAMLARHGAALMETAREHGVALLFEASVGGGIPIIRVLQQGLAANRITAIYGILNGTTNYILTRMAGMGLSFAAALAEAQEKGYAEPDPRFDIEGLDTAHKTAILAWLAFGRAPQGDEVHAEGIARIAPEDLIFAADNGYAIKLLGIARRASAPTALAASTVSTSSTPDEGPAGAIELRAHPSLVRSSNILAAVSGVFNGVMVEGDPIGRTMFYGRGAGPDATSSAVLSDVIALADAIASGGLARESRLLNAAMQTRERPAVLPMDRLEGSYYLRSGKGASRGNDLIKELKKAGVEVQILKTEENGVVQVLTQRVREGVLVDALKELKDDPPLMIRTLED